MIRMKNRSFSGLIIILSMLLSSWREPSGRGYDPNMTDIGLPDGNTTLIGLGVALVGIGVGQILVRVEKDTGPIGCIGLILHAAGLLGLIPLLFWITAALGTIMSVVGVILIILVIIALVVSSLKK